MIDWTEQWTLHAQNFHDGLAHIELGCGKTLRLKAGPGFGDCSHPSTRLVLELMKAYAPGKCIVDLGCGSGVLSLSAAMMGAEQVYGIDICEEAILHARENAKINQLSNVQFGRRGVKGDLLLINMISSEQEGAWKEHAYLHDFEGIVISSGILAEQKETYIAQVLSRGWNLLSLKEEQGWVGLVFMSFGIQY